MRQYEYIIYKSKYARWLEEEQRREEWDETVDRYVNHWADKADAEVLAELRDAIYNREVMPSMRALMTAGPALERDNVAGFNCSYVPIDHVRAFDELVYILMCGTGVGYSVERKYIKQLPQLPEEFHDTESTIVVADSKIGWAKAARELISFLYAGQVPTVDVSKVRPSGERLRVFGGRASGPEPLLKAFRKITNIFRDAKQAQLTDVEVSDIVCILAAMNVVGGVRRSALIACTSPSSQDMSKYKQGEQRTRNPHRELANISAVYTERPSLPFYQTEMVNLYEGYNGERGILNRAALQSVAGRNGRRDTDWDFGTNPCSEIILRPNQFCNLSEVVVRSSDTLDDLKEKVRKATILGTLQATLTDFRYLRSIWKKNTEEEALLGVSLTGIMDHPVLSGGENLTQWLEEMKDVAIQTNAEWADRLGINRSAAITCVKPSGTVSQLCNTASGIHTRFSPHYERSIRLDHKDPLCEFLIDGGCKYERERRPDGTEGDKWVFFFPEKAPDGAVCTTDQGAIEALNMWRIYSKHWCEHKPSVTVSYTDDEWFDVVSYIWKHFDEMSGISLLPYDGHVYDQAPYRPIAEEEYNELLAKVPELDWSLLPPYETDKGGDITTGSQELACTAGACEL